MRRQILPAVLIFAAAGAATTRQSDEPLEPMLVAARALPPDFHADGLLRLVEQERIKKKDVAVELLQEAFNAAGGAEAPLPLTYVVGGGPVDSPSGKTAQAHEARLDRLSLRTRAVRLVVSRDESLARELIDRIGDPEWPSLSCADRLAPDSVAFFLILTEVTNTAFSKAERADERHVEMVARYLGAVDTPLELPPAAESLLKLQLSRAQFERLLTVFAGAMGAVQGDDRAFTFSMEPHNLPRSIVALRDRARQESVPAYALIAAYRSYLVRHLSGRRCADRLGLGRA